MISPFLTVPLFVFSLLFRPCLCDKSPNENVYPCWQANDFEFHCPTKNGYIVVHTKEEEIVIDCPFGLEDLTTQLFLGINTIKTTNFTLNDCPWPKEPFKNFLATFNLTQVHSLEFLKSSPETEMGVDFLKGLEDLQKLKLSDYNLQNLDEKTLSYTPNLLILELQDNNLTLKEDMFKHVPLVKFLDLSGNNLEHLPPNIFGDMKDLTILHLWRNKLTEVDDAVFDSLHKLESLELSINKIRKISKGAFRKLRKLRQLSLSKNKLRKVPQNLFKGNRKLRIINMSHNFHFVPPDYVFANMRLKEVNLRSCLLKTLPKHIFVNTTSLKIIKLDDNHLNYIPESLFEGLFNLKKITLQDNKIESISKIFTGLKKLQHLSLQNNLISIVPPEVFEDLNSLEYLDLSNNRITNINYQLFINKNNLRIVKLSRNSIVTPFDQIIDLSEVSLTKLDLSHNNITNFKLKNFKPKTVVAINLDYNFIRAVDFQKFDLNSNSSKIKIFMKNNPIKCDCHNFDLFEFRTREQKTDNLDIRIDDSTCTNLEKQKNDTLELSDFTCPLTEVSNYQTNYTECPEKCSCDWRPFDKSIVVDCSFKNLTKFPNIDFSQVGVKYSQIIVNLQGNYLTAGPDNVTAHDNITHLFLSDNEIQNVGWLPSKLRVLRLDHNHITRLDDKVVKQLNKTRLVELTLHDNPWLCDCDSLPLSVFLRKHDNVDRNGVRCVNTNLFLVDLKEADLCQNRFFLYLILTVLSVLLILAISFAAYFRCKESIKIWLFAHNFCLSCISEEEVDKDKKYDVFISYSHKDEQFVVRTLVPELEQSSRSYKVCFHERDWIPGEFIPTQICTSVQQSRRTLIVLSRSYLESTWGSIEFRVAHSEAMKDGVRRVIIVLYGDVDVNSLDQELKTYLKNNTYVKWGDQYFWNKLKYALPHRKMVSKCDKRCMHTNLIISNDQHVLIEPDLNSGTTPPVNTSPSLVKTDRFLF